MVKIVSHEMLQSGEEPPKIEFPCDYPIKILGEAGKDFEQQVLAAVKRHAPDVDASSASIKESSKGRFRSITVVIQATGERQLEELFADLKLIKAVKMVI